MLGSFDLLLNALLLFRQLERERADGPPGARPQTDSAAIGALSEQWRQRRTHSRSRWATRRPECLDDRRISGHASRDDYSLRQRLRRQRRNYPGKAQ